MKIVRIISFLLAMIGVFTVFQIALEVATTNMSSHVLEKTICSLISLVGILSIILGLLKTEGFLDGFPFLKRTYKETPYLNQSIRFIFTLLGLLVVLGMLIKATVTFAALPGVIDKTVIPIPNEPLPEEEHQPEGIPWQHFRHSLDPWPPGPDPETPVPDPVYPRPRPRDQIWNLK